MAQSTRSETFQFISVTDRSDNARRRNRYIAKSHTARVNRQRGRMRRDGGTDPRSCETAQQPPLEAGLHTSGAAVAPAPTNPEKSATHEASPDAWLLPRHRLTPSPEEFAILLPLSPTFGTLSTNAYVPGSKYGGLFEERYDAVNYFIRNVLSNFMTKRDVAWYFQAFCERPCVFHAMHLSAANHQDRMVGKIVRTKDPEVIAHKIEAVRRLNSAMSWLDRADIDCLFMVMTSIMRTEPRQDELQPDEGLLFSPHLPRLNNLDVYGRGKIGQTNPVHRKALGFLLARVGGLRGLKSAGLAKATCGHDLFLVSRVLSRPVMENVWTTKALIGSIMLMPCLERRTGFVDCIPGGLPNEMLSTLVYVSAVDQVLAQARGRNLDDEEADRQRCAVNDAHHRLMSLYPWPDLSEDERQSSCLETYECCRLTAILYSCAVLFPVPVASGWHIELLGRLRTLLEGSWLWSQLKGTSSLVIWSLCIAAIAAFKTDHRRFFEQAFRDALLNQTLTDWADVRSIVKEFLWSDAACSQGVLVLWDRLQIKKELPSVNGWNDRI